VPTSFWSKGLNFECVRCSSCCRHEPGLVLLSNLDINSLMAFLGLDFQNFFSKYCRLVDIGPGKMISLLETIVYDCILWKDGIGCSVYSARPVQCRTYPFWSGILDSQEDWNRERHYCPGVGQGALCSRSDIEEALWAYRKNSPVLLSSDAKPETLDENKILGR